MVLRLYFNLSGRQTIDYIMSLTAITGGIFTLPNMGLLLICQLNLLHPCGNLGCRLMILLTPIQLAACGLSKAFGIAALWILPRAHCNQWRAPINRCKLPAVIPVAYIWWLARPILQIKW